MPQLAQVRQTSGVAGGDVGACRPVLGAGGRAAFQRVVPYFGRLNCVVAGRSGVSALVSAT